MCLCTWQVRYVGVSNETAYGVMRFISVAEQTGLPKIVSIQNCYNLLVCLSFACLQFVLTMLILCGHNYDRNPAWLTEQA